MLSKCVAILGGTLTLGGWIPLVIGIALEWNWLALLGGLAIFIGLFVSLGASTANHVDED